MTIEDKAATARAHLGGSMAMRKTAVESGLNLAKIQGEGRPMTEAPVNLAALGIKSGPAIP